MIYDIDHYRFLVKLRNSGVVNMYGATPYLEEYFGLKSTDAGKVLTDWIKSFKLPVAEQPKDGRESYE